MAAGSHRPFSFEETEVESGQYGCPMLSRAREIYAPGIALPSHRCNFGWAIHGEADVERCMAVESAVECWKAAQERVSVLPGPAPRQPQEKIPAD
jgi:hypothetical protein